MEKVIFINKEGQPISVDGIESHIALANYILSKSKELKAEFKESGKMDPVDFFICNKGYIKVNDTGYYKVVSYSSRNISELQLSMIAALAQDGYTLDDRALDKYSSSSRDKEYRW